MSTRRNSRWLHSRLRRLDAKIQSVEKSSPDNLRFLAVFNDITPESIKRCRARRNNILSYIAGR